MYDLMNTDLIEDWETLLMLNAQYRLHCQGWRDWRNLNNRYLFRLDNRLFNKSIVYMKCVHCLKVYKLYYQNITGTVLWQIEKAEAL